MVPSRLQSAFEQVGWKTIARAAFRRLGVHVARVDRIDRSQGLREDPFGDKLRILEFAGAAREPRIFDVGANIGQSATKYRATFPDANIHSFEPLPKAFDKLRELTVNDHRLTAVNTALHASPGRRQFHSNRGGSNQTSSFLPPASSAKHCYDPSVFEQDELITVETTTLDAYCTTHSVEHIHILKLDTQGSEGDVLRGAASMFGRGAVTMAYVEVVFTPLYEGNSLYHDLAVTLESYDLELFRIYYLNHGAGGRLIGGDALFVQRPLLRSFLDGFTLA